jgi:hypothetical protein
MNKIHSNHPLIRTDTRGSPRSGASLSLSASLRLLLLLGILMGTPIAYGWPFGSPGNRPKITRVNCPNCSGTGVVAGRCAPCRGTGNRVSGFFNPIRCSSCNGTGSVSMRCLSCGGTGRVLRVD